MARGILSLIALSALTAFAPAPFPRPSRHGTTDEISITTFQGKWRVVSMRQVSADGNHQPYAWGVSHVGVKSDNWTFEYSNGQGETAYQITIDNVKRPAHLDFWNRGQAQQPARAPGQGIIRKKGDVVEIIYIFGNNNRPVSFEQPPVGQYWLTLQRIG